SLRTRMRRALRLLITQRAARWVVRLKLRVSGSSGMAMMSEPPDSGVAAGGSAVGSALIVAVASGGAVAVPPRTVHPGRISVRQSSGRITRVQQREATTRCSLQADATAARVRGWEHKNQCGAV